MDIPHGAVLPAEYVLEFGEFPAWDGWVIVRVGELTALELISGKQAPYQVKIERVGTPPHPQKIDHVRHPFIAVRRHGLLRIAVTREETEELVPLVRFGKWTERRFTRERFRVLPLVLCGRVRWI